MGSPGWLGKKNFAKLFPSYKADFFGLLPPHRLQYLGTLYKALDPKDMGWAVGAHEEPGELGFHAVSGRQVWPEVESRLGRHAEVADLPTSLVWIVKFTEEDPGVLVLIWPYLCIPLHSHSGLLTGVCCLCDPLFEFSIWLQVHL